MGRSGVVDVETQPMARSMQRERFLALFRENFVDVAFEDPEIDQTPRQHALSRRVDVVERPAGETLADGVVLRGPDEVPNRRLLPRRKARREERARNVRRIEI